MSGQRQVVKRCYVRKREVLCLAHLGLQAAACGRHATPGPRTLGGRRGTRCVACAARQRAPGPPPDTRVPQAGPEHGRTASSGWPGAVKVPTVVFK